MTEAAREAATALVSLLGLSGRDGCAWVRQDGNTETIILAVNENWLARRQPIINKFRGFNIRVEAPLFGLG
jgi:hypothetical protein